MHPFLETFEQQVMAHREKLAVADQSLMLEYPKLRAVAAGLAERIAAASDNRFVGILAPGSSAGAAAIVACWYAGRVPVPLNFMLRPRELGIVVKDAGLDFALTVEHFSELADGVGLRQLQLNAQSLVPGEAAVPAAGADDLGVLLYTSGTAGVPKGVELTFGNLVSNATSAIAHAQITADQVFLSVVPQFHSIGFTAMTVIPLLLGATVWYLPRFSPLTVVNAIADKQVSILMAIPSMYAALAGMKSVEPESVSSLRLAISGGEPLPPTVAEAFQHRFGRTLYNGYGMTESAPIVALNTPHAFQSGSVGRPIPGVKVEILSDAGDALPAAEVGEIVVRGHSVMRGYYNQPEATRQTLRDGKLHTGDMGYLDDNGFLFITGRKKEMLIVGGENVFPSEIETVLLQHDAVAEAAVVGEPDATRCEIPVAYVIAAEGAGAVEDVLRDHCRERLANYKVPRRIYLVDELPRSPTGKVLKRELKPTPAS